VRPDDIREEPEPKFVQIAAARLYNQGHVLYALDEAGRVWKKGTRVNYVSREQVVVWVPLPEERMPS
jgi:hypothetical protein